MSATQRAGKAKKRVRFALQHNEPRSTAPDPAAFLVGLPATHSWMLACMLKKKILCDGNERVSQTAVRDVATKTEAADDPLSCRLKELNLRIVAGREADTFKCEWRTAEPEAQSTCKEE